MTEPLVPATGQGVLHLFWRVPTADQTPVDAAAVAAAVKGAEAAFIAVGTPPGEDGSADLRYVLAVAKEIGEKMSDHILHG